MYFTKCLCPTYAPGVILIFFSFFLFLFIVFSFYLLLIESCFHLYLNLRNYYISNNFPKSPKQSFNDKIHLKRVFFHTLKTLNPGKVGPDFRIYDSSNRSSHVCKRKAQQFVRGLSLTFCFIQARQAQKDYNFFFYIQLGFFSFLFFLIFYIYIQCVKKTKKK